MSSSTNGSRGARLALVGWSVAAPEPKPVVVPAGEPGTIDGGRVVVPFVVIEHEGDHGSLVGILVLDQAVA